MTRGDLYPSLRVASRVLDEGDEARRHEPPRPDRYTGPGDLADFDHTATGDHLDPPSRSGRHDVEGLDTLTGIDDGFDSIAFHVS